MADDKPAEKPVEEAPKEEPKEPQEAPKEDRTAQQFDKLKESNKELKEEKDKYKKLYESYDKPTNQAPNAQQYQNLDQGQVNQAFQSMVDSDGYLDGNKLTQVLLQMNQRAAKAEQNAQQAQKQALDSQKQLRDFEETRATREVHKKYPTLDPNNKEEFNSKFFKAVYNELGMKAKRGEEPMAEDYMKAADDVYNDFFAEKEVTKKEKEEQAKKTEETSDAKASMNAAKPNSPIVKGYYDDQQEEELIKSVRAGKRGSVAELLRRRGQ